jgi:hypothetical protein
MRKINILHSLKNFFLHSRIFRYFPEKVFCLSFIYMLTMQAEGNEQKTTSEHQGDTISFAGYTWITKDSYGKHTGPGNNYFSGTRENVFVDAEGRLHLRMTYRNDKWYCPEVRLEKSLGYGRYYFYLDPLPQKLDKDIVIGLFLYDREDTSNFHKEIDIEISTWGKDSSLNSQYVIQPKEGEAHRFETDLNQGTKHMIELRRKKIAFRSYYDGANLDDIPLELANYKVKPDYDYYTHNERVSMNVWLYHTSEPSNLKEFELIIAKFEFKQFWYDKIFKHTNEDNDKEKKNEEPKEK